MYGLGFLFNGISTLGYLMLNLSLLDIIKDTKTHSRGQTVCVWGGHSFPNSITTKVNVIVHLEFKTT